MELVGTVNEIFNFGNFSIRTLKIGDNIYFNGKDVAHALGFVRTANAISHYVDEVDKIRWGVPESGTPSVYITEAAMYIFVIRCNMPASRHFVNWVKEVLVTIRKTGRYELDDYRTFKTIADRVDRNTPNFEEFKASNDQLTEKLKDPEQQERGRRGGLKAQANRREMKKEWKQQKIDLAMFQLTGQLLTHAVEKTRK